MQGRVLEDVSREVDAETIRQPVGVCAAIVPFNFPAMVPFWFLPFAIGCGNTFILKPSEQVPLTQQSLFEVLDELGLPAGVVNLVNGGAEVVERDPRLTRASTRSRSSARRLSRGIVYERAAATGKRVQALGGAKNHMVVMPDAVIDKTVSGIIGRPSAPPASAAWRARWWSRWSRRTSGCSPRWRRPRAAMRVGDGARPGRSGRAR